MGKRGGDGWRVGGSGLWFDGRDGKEGGWVGATSMGGGRREGVDRYVIYNAEKISWNVIL